MTPKTSRREFLSTGLMVPVAGAGLGMGLVSSAVVAASVTPVTPVKLDY